MIYSKRVILSIALCIVGIFSVFAAIDNDRKYIAHGAGTIDGYRYTNSLEALDLSYAKGFRMFELDLIYTDDGHLVAAHDWDVWRRMTKFDQECITKEIFLAHKLYDLYTPLSMDEINQWFAQHEDAILVTDKMNSPAEMVELFVFPDRLFMELFTFGAIEQAQALGVDFMLSEGLLYDIEGSQLDYLQEHNIEALAVNRKLATQSERYSNFFLQCKELGIRTYAFGLDPNEYTEKYVLEHEMQYFYGIYADNWIDEFDVETGILQTKNNNRVVAYNKDGMLLVQAEGTAIQNIAIYDALGRCLFFDYPIDNQLFQMEWMEKGLIFITVTTTQGAESIKLYVP
jgi:hypothetical protein